MDLQTIINCNNAFIESIRSSRYLFIFDDAERTFSNPIDSPNSLHTFIRSLLDKTVSRVIVTSLVPLDYLNLLDLDHSTEMNRTPNLNGDEVLLSGLTPHLSSQLFFYNRPRGLTHNDVIWNDPTRSTNHLYQNPVLAACEGFPGRILKLVSFLTMKSLQDLKPDVDEIVRKDLAVEHMLYTSILSKFLDVEGITFWLSVPNTTKYRANVRWVDLSQRIQTLFIHFCDAASRPLSSADLDVLASKFDVSASGLVSISKYAQVWSTFLLPWLRLMKRLSTIWFHKVEDLKSCRMILSLQPTPDTIPMNMLTSTETTPILPDSPIHTHNPPILFNFLTEDQQMRMLSDFTPHKFFLRLSQSMPNAIAISYNDRFGNFQKTLVHLENDGFRLFQDTRHYRTLNELIVQSDPLKYLYPLDHRSPEHHSSRLFALTNN
jgi:hypothetical protein